MSGPALGGLPLAWAGPAQAQPEPAAAPSAEIEVVVRASPRHPQAGPKDRGIPASIIGREQLLAPGAGAADLLRRQVGVQIVESGGLGAPASASIRGSSASQLPIYLGGVRLNDDLTGSVDLGSLPLWLLERVEIYRGAAPLEADRLGIAGAIFLEPRSPESANSGAGLALGSYGARSGWLYARSGTRAHSALVGLRLESAQNDYTFFDDRGTLFDASDGRERRRSNIDLTSVDVWAITHSRIGQARVRGLLNRVQREQGAARLALLPSRAARVRFERTLVAASTHVPLGESDSSIEALTAFVGQSSQIDDPSYELALRANQLSVRGERVSQRLGATVVLTDALVLRPVFDASSERLLRFERGESDSGSLPALAARRSVARLATSGELHVGGPFSLFGLVAGECHSTRALAHGRDCLGPIGRGTLLAGAGRFAAYAGAGRAVRVPSLGELYGTSVLIRGNTALKAETAWTADAGLRWIAQPGTWIDVALFSRWTSELLSFVRSSEGYVKPINLGSARVQGLELDAAASLHDRFSARLSLTLLDARDTSPHRTTQNDVLPFQSRLVAVPALRAKLVRGEAGALSQAWSELRYIHQSSRFGDAAGLAVIPAQGSLELELAAETFSSQLLLRARASNLLDQRRFDSVGFPLPGRSVFSSLEVSW